MIDALLKPFDVITTWPIELQCFHAVAVSGIGFAFSAMVRESTKNRCLRNWARATGAASFVFLAMFAVHTTQQVEKLNTELMVRQQNRKASEIAEEAIVTLISKRGHSIEIGEDNGVRRVGREFRQCDGQLRSCCSEYADSKRRLAASRMGGNGGDGAGHDGMVVAPRVFEQSAAAFCRWFGAGENAGSFEFTGETQGERF